VKRQKRVSPIPPTSVVRVLRTQRTLREGQRFRIGYYNSQDGLDLVWLVNEQGEYEQTADQQFINDNFAIELRSEERDLFGKNREMLGPLARRLNLKRPSLVVYVTVGDPEIDISEQVIISAIDAGADVIELGVPFSDPLADGPVIQRASERALRGGTTLKEVLALARRIRAQRPHAGLIIFSYLNPIMRYGLKQFAADAKSAGVDGVLVTDFTVEESDEYRKTIHAQGLATIFLAAPTSTDARLKRVAQASTGFIYAVSRTGVTGADKQADIRGEVQSLVKRIRKYTKLPIAVGFGIGTPDQFRQVTEFADAAVVGSAIVKLIEENGASAPEAVANFIRKLKN
jgi:tryptophan synthase alpha chain